MSEPISPVFAGLPSHLKEVILGPGKNDNALPMPIVYDGNNLYTRWKLTPAEIQYVVETGTIIIAVKGSVTYPIYAIAQNAGVMQNGRIGFIPHEGEDADPLERLIKL